MHRMTGLLLLLWAGATVSSMLDLQKRIIGGKDCERKYHVKLLDAHNDFVCGGSLISNEWILTSLHCYPVQKAELYPYGKKNTKDIIQAVPYKDADPKAIKKIHDIMLLKIKKVDGVTTVNPPNCGEQPKEKEEVEVAGHTKEIVGRDGKKKCDETAQLQCAKAPVVSCDPYLDCIEKSIVLSAADPHNQHLFCADTQKVNACGGDSGGGVVFKDKIYGVLMGSGDPGCTLPMVFMKVCKYKGWINTKTGLFP